MSGRDATTKASEFLHSRSSTARGALCHRYLEKILALSERVAAAWLQEDWERPEEMMWLLSEFEDTFREGYDPLPFVPEIPSLRQLDPRIRERLEIALEREFRERFRPEDRLTSYRAAAATFRETFEDWYKQVSSSGPDPASAARWKAFLARAGNLHALLSDPELRCRWIP